MILTSGSTIGRYTVMDVAGRGTSSIVYRAADPSGVTVAVKAIREELLAEAEIRATLQRFDREVVIGHALRHPQIVRLIEAGEHEGSPYLVMDFVTGETFDALIRAQAPLPPEMARDIVVKVLEALEHAHRRNVIHRDIKPANIVLRHSVADPVLMDFGIARLEGSDLTRHGELLGTPAYLAPEQLRGQPIDRRADLFATGVMLYLAVTGRRPFDGSIAEIMRRICFDDPAPISTLVPELAALDPILARALAKEPGERYRSAAEFAAELGDLQFETRLTSYDPAAEATQVDRSGDPVTLEELAELFERVAIDGVNETLADHIQRLMGEVTGNSHWQLAALCGGPVLARIAELLLATAPLPGRKTERRGHWLSGIELFTILLGQALGGPDAAGAERVAADLAYALAAGIVAYGSDVAERLTPDEAPDIGIEALSLLRVDSISFGLTRLGAAQERRLVEASARVIAGQVVRRAARTMQDYAESRDDMARFDVVNMLVNVEDLIALAARLIEDADSVESGRADPVAARSIAALTVLLDAMTGLVGAAKADLDQALSSEDQDEIGSFIGNLKQMMLIHRFCSRLSGALFQPRLALLSQEIYALVTRLTAVVTDGGASPVRQERVSGLYEIATIVGWRDLATRLLLHVRPSLHSL